MSPGRLLRDARRRHGLTQAQLAARARTSQAAISRIERDVVSPSVATLASLLNLMNEELVLEAREIDWGHDETLLEEKLRKTADERFRHGVSLPDPALSSRPWRSSSGARER
jgi:transcriptional regulator with XRE-family HTH domain